MTKIQNRTLVTLALIFCAGLAGCALLPPSKDVERPKGEGYGYLARTYHRDMMHTYSTIEFCYWDKNGKRTPIWPALDEYVPIGTNAALFKGNLVDGPTGKYPGMLGPIRLFGVEQTGPVVDITDEVVLAWTKPSRANFPESIKRESIGDLRKTANGYTVKVWVQNIGTGTVELTQDQLLSMVREGKAKGKPMKDLGTGTPYLKRDLEAESRGQN